MEIKEDENQSRKIIWFNLPCSTSVKTDIGRIFLNLISENFPARHKLRCVYSSRKSKFFPNPIMLRPNPFPFCSPILAGSVVGFSQARQNKFQIGAAIQSKYRLSMKAERLMAWGPGARSRAPGGAQGQSPSRGPGDSAPGSFWVLAFVKGLQRLSWKYFFSLNQPRPGAENVSIK